MNSLDPLLPVRRETRQPCRDFWAMIRWGIVLASGIWIVVTLFERITSI